MISILKIIENTLSKCHKEIPGKPTRAFIFPSFSSFVKNKMGGVNGSSPWKNVILIHINPTVEDWETTLESTIAHEYNHSVVYNYNSFKTLLEGIILEGFAEHFREHVVGGEKAPWSRAVSEEECKKYFPKLEDKLNSKDSQVYRRVFYGSEQFPLWLGYSLGYQIVKSFLSKNKRMSWSTIVKIKSKEILKQSSF